MATSLFSAIPRHVSHECFQGHPALLAEFPLGESARFTFRCQPVGFLTAAPPPRSLLLFVHTPTASNAGAAWKDGFALTDTVELSPEATPTSTDRRELVRLVLAPGLLAVLLLLKPSIFNGIPPCAAGFLERHCLTYLSIVPSSCARYTSPDAVTTVPCPLLFPP
jgi:hypothetical protein